MPKDTDKKITIVYVIDFLATRDGIVGGTERQLLETITLLNRHRFRPILVCLQEFTKSDIWEKLDCEKRLLHVYSFKSIKCILQFLSFVTFLMRNRVHITQTYFFDSTVFGVLAAKIARVDSIIVCRRDMGFWYTNKIIMILKIINKIVDRFLVNSNAVKETLIRHENVSKDKINVIYNSINYEHLNSVRKKNLAENYSETMKNNFVVGIAANLNRSIKRVDLFIKAAADIAMKINNVVFLILGDGNLKRGLQNLAQELKIVDKIIFAGMKCDVYPYVAAFDVGVISSDSEGFSNSVLEYMAMGVPVVATDVGGNREIVQDGITGYLVPRNNPKAMAEKICNLLENSRLRNEMGKAARNLIKEYTRDRKIKELEAYYQGLLATGHK